MSARAHLVSYEPATYDDLESAPADYTVELVGGRLHAQPRPRGKHIGIEATLGMRLGPPFQLGDGGPGGWWILDEPEIHFIQDVEVTVPDLAGWRRERMPSLPEDHRFRIIPDWVCEIVSPSTRRFDLDEKKPLYARYGVRWLWLLDPDADVLEACTLAAGGWHSERTFGPDDPVDADPFRGVQFTVASLCR